MNTPTEKNPDWNFAVVVAWHQPEQLQKFLDGWHLDETALPSWLFLQQDKDRSGCARTKNAGIERAITSGAEYIGVLDDDCISDAPNGPGTLEGWALAHVAAMRPQQVKMFHVITEPPSRGTPYFTRSIEMPVAASMGYWNNIGDYDAPGQLVHGATKPMKFYREAIHGKYAAFSGMNFMFRASWWPIPSLIDVARFDDLWMGLILEKIAYARGYCINLGGPYVRHDRQSNLWRNLDDEVKFLERHETLWVDIHKHPSTDYAELVKLLPEKIT